MVQSAWIASCHAFYFQFVTFDDMASTTALTISFSWEPWTAALVLWK